MKYLFLTIFLFTITTFASDCKRPQNLKMEIKNQNILIGDVINFEISFKVDEKSNLFLKESDFSPFELIKKSSKKIKTKDGYYQFFYLDLSIYETGNKKIPEFEIVSVNESKQSCIIIPEKKIIVLSVLKNGKERGIKDIKKTTEIKEKTYLILWILGFLILLLIIILFYRFFKYKHSIVEKEIIIKKIDPVDLAYKKLSKLTQDNLLKDNRIKDYYFRLSEIIREYLGGVYTFDSIEMTTDELKKELNKIPLFKREHIPLVNNFLDDTDFVKFSKFKPDSDEINRVTTIAFDIIEKLKPLKSEVEK